MATTTPRTPNPPASGYPTPPAPRGDTRPFWRKHFFKLTLLPLGLAAALWFLVVQPRTSTTVDEAFPTAAPRASVAAVIAATPAPTLAPTLAPTVAPTSAPTATVAPIVAATTAPTSAPAVSPATTSAPPTVAPTVAPIVAPTAALTAAPTAIPAPTGPVAVKSGAFANVLFAGSGNAAIFRLPDGKYVLRLDNLSVTNGPDLRVRLLGPNGAALDLGALKATRGNQNYDLPATFDPAAYDVADIWCRSFREQFIKAPLG